MSIRDDNFTSPDALRKLYRRPRNPLREAEIEPVPQQQTALSDVQITAPVGAAPVIVPAGTDPVVGSGNVGSGIGRRQDPIIDFDDTGGTLQI